MTEFRTLSGRTDAQGADCRAGRERKDHPVVRLLRPANRPAPWTSRLVHRVDRALTVLERLRSFQVSPSPWRPGKIPWIPAVGGNGARGAHPGDDHQHGQMRTPAWILQL